MSRTLVVGATGQLGGAVAGRLAERGGGVCALVRQGSETGALEAAGVELVRGDLTRPESLPPALAGVERIVATATAAARGGGDTLETVDRHGYAALIDAAERAGVARMLFVSAHGFAADSPVALARVKAATESRLAAGRLDWTVLRPVLFMESWIAWILGAQLELGDELTVIGDAATPYPFVSLGDVAELAVASLGHPSASRRRIELSAGTASYRQIAGWISAATGREVRLRQVPPGSELPGVPPIVCELWSWAAAGAMEPIETPEVAQEFGLGLISPRDFVAAAFSA